MTSQGQRLEAKRIESPLAKYNSLGQLTCIVCSQVVKSELLWTAHVNSKVHLDNKAKLKSKLKSSDDATTFKKPASVPTKESKSADSSSGAQKRSLDDNDPTEGKRQRMNNLVAKTNKMDLNKLIQEAEAESDDLPATPVAAVLPMETQEPTTTSQAEAVSEPAPAALPEGFFDDPDLDAKVRGTSRAETLEAEYEAFKKAMQIEEAKSSAIIEQDDQNRELDRDLDEADELIARWSKIESLHQKRDELAKTKSVAKKQAAKTADSDSDDSDVDLANVFDLKLRDKKLIN